MSLLILQNVNPGPPFHPASLHRQGLSTLPPSLKSPVQSLGFVRQQLASLGISLDRLLDLSFLCSLCPAESVRIPPCAFSFLKNLGHVSPTVVHVSPCRWMYLFMSFNFSGVLGGIRDNHLRSVPQV